MLPVEPKNATLFFGLKKHSVIDGVISGESFFVMLMFCLPLPLSSVGCCESRDLCSLMRVWCGGGGGGGFGFVFGPSAFNCRAGDHFSYVVR